MALKSLIEAAMHLCLRVETVEYFVKHCPKRGQTRTLQTVETAAGVVFDEVELGNFVAYLNEPWPLPEKGGRAAVPEKISDDVKDEAHHACAICGHMDNGEVAHIKSWAVSLNNAPNNLIFLCPNHHTKYDLGFKPASNLTQEEVIAAKRLKQNSRRRILKYEANATKSLQSLISFINGIEESLSKEHAHNFQSIYVTEMQNLISTIPELSLRSEEEAGKDKLVTAPKKRNCENCTKISGPCKRHKRCLQRERSAIQSTEFNYSNKRNPD